MNKCRICNSINLTTRKKDCQFLENGLDNAILVSIGVSECPDCGEEFVLIPNYATCKKIRDTTRKKLIERLKGKSLGGSPDKQYIILPCFFDFPGMRTYLPRRKEIRGTILENKKRGCISCQPLEISLVAGGGFEPPTFGL